jgi:formate-dependent nitrite reductase cytochrome c552 subunit
MQPQEQQVLNQPDPKTAMAMRMKQLDAQTRTQMGQMKAQTEQQKNMLEFKAKTGETGERSARELLKLLAQDRIAQWNAMNDANQGTTPPDSGT